MAKELLYEMGKGTLIAGVMLALSLEGKDHVLQGLILISSLMLGGNLMALTRGNRPLI